MNEIPEANNNWDSPPSGLPPPQPMGGTTETGPTASYDPFAKKDEVPIGKSSKPLIPKVSIYDRQSILNLLVVFGIMSIIVGASICSLSGIVFRPESPQSGADYDEIEEYNDDVDTRNQVSSFIYMMGSTILMIGLLLVIFKVGLIVVSSTFPTGLRIAAGILLVVLIPFFLTIFMMAGPARLLTNIDGGYYYGW